MTKQDAIDDLAKQIEALHLTLDRTCHVVGDEVWQKLAALIPWHENVDQRAVKQLRAFAEAIDA